ncbi:MAG: hypothetical protein HC822_06970 [Oscillochloris sp.]|nr:hypothetical protein [Oscillochloris sp.]
MTIYTDTVFAPIDYDHKLQRLAGGNETEVYRSDDGRFVVKVKEELGGDWAVALAHAQEMRAAAERYAACLGERHSIPSYYLLARDSNGKVQVLAIQPLVQAQPLYSLEYEKLSPAERHALSVELDRVIRRALRHYARHGEMPDLYGRTSTGGVDRHRQRSWRQLPERMWSFLVERTLLQSHNLLWTGGATGRAILVDYDFVRRSALYRALYFLVRVMLFWRDRAVIFLRLRR